MLPKVDSMVVDMNLDKLFYKLQWIFLVSLFL